MGESQQPEKTRQERHTAGKFPGLAEGTTPLGGVPEHAAEEGKSPAPEETQGQMPGFRPTVEYVPVVADQPAAGGQSKPRELPSVPGYEILSELGRGGMGVVYRARQQGLNRPVALKMILAGSHAGPEQLARFQTEAEAVAQLVHPNIVQIYEIGRYKGLPYFSLELVEGQSLAHKLSGKPLEANEAARLVETLARTMHYAHQRGIVHRDLKPANVLLTSDGVPKISDFGLAKRLDDDSSQTRTGTVMGTPSYMAPEQAKGATHEVGPLSDVYALGGVLYALLTGRPPFVAANAMDTVMQVLRDEPVPPTRLQPKVPRDLETICLKCLQKDPLKRYADAEALAEDLRRFQAGEPILARPISHWERFWRWCRRNPRVTVPSAAAVLLALVLMIGGPATALVVYQQKQAAVMARALAQENARKARQAEAEAVRAKERAVDNEQKAIEARQVAATQSKLALDALRTLVHDVQAELEQRPRMQPLRRRLIQTALRGLDRVAAIGTDASEKDITTAGAHRRMGDIFLELGQNEKALQQYQLCHAIVEQMYRQGRLPHPFDNLSRSLTNLAEAARRAGDSAAAEAYLLEALRVRREWAQQDPTNRYIPQNVAATLGQLGSVCLMTSDLDQAQQYCEESLKLRKEWLQWAPNSVNARRELAGAYDAMARVYLRQGKIEDAERHAQQAIDTFQEGATSSGDDRTYRWNLALFHTRLGAVQLMAGKPSQAAAAYARAIPVLQEFNSRDPENTYLKRNLAEALYGMGTALLKSDDPEAAQYYQEALELRRQLATEGPDNKAEQAGWMLCLARVGDHQAAAEIGHRLRASADGPRILYSVASGYAVCADGAARDGKLEPEEQTLLAERYGRLAVETLRAAIANGYHVTAELQLDPDLAAVRDRPDFHELLEAAR